MADSAREQLQALAREDGERAAGLVVRAFVHEVRNALNPLGLQIAIIQRRLAKGDTNVAEVVEGLRETVTVAFAALDTASKLGQDLAPPHKDDSKQRELWDRLRGEI